MSIENSENEIGVKLYDESDAELEKEDDGIGSELKNEQEVIALFSKLYDLINNERRKLYEETSNIMLHRSTKIMGNKNVMTW